MTALLIASTASAWPVARTLTLAEGERDIVGVGSLEVLDAAPTGVVALERLDEARELLVEAVSPGETLLLLADEQRLAVWRVRVSARTSGRSSEAAPPKRAPAATGRADAARAPSARISPPAPVRTETVPSKTARSDTASALAEACPSVARVGRALRGEVASAECVRALNAYLKQGPVQAGDVVLTFTIAAAHAQLAQLSEAIRATGAKNVTPYFSGGTLELRGEAPEDLRLPVLWAVFRARIGDPATVDRVTWRAP